MTTTWLYAPMTAELEGIFPRVTLEDLEELLRRHHYVRVKEEYWQQLRSWERRTKDGLSFRVWCPTRDDWADFIKVTKRMLEAMAATAHHLDATTSAFHVDLLRELGDICDARRRVETGEPLVWMTDEPCFACNASGTRMVRIATFDRNVGTHKRGDPITKPLCRTCDEGTS